MRNEREKERTNGVGIDLPLMVLFLLLVMIFDKSTAPLKDVALDTPNGVEIVEVVDRDGETIIEGEEIEESNYASDRVLEELSEEEMEYIYSVGEVVDIEMDGEIIHFVVYNIIEDDALLREIGVQNGKELLFKNMKNKQ